MKIAKFVLFVFLIVFMFVSYSKEGFANYEVNGAINETVQAIGAVSRAVKDFQKRYDYLPGDLPNPQDVIAACSEINCVGGNGDLIIGRPLTDISGTDFTGESELFWKHLTASGLLRVGFSRDMAIGGRLLVIYYDGNEVLPFSYDGHPPQIGHYLVLTGNNFINENSYFLTAQNAASIDKKVDDGTPYGTVVAGGKLECVREYQEGDFHSYKYVYNEPIKTKEHTVKGYSAPCAFLYIWISE